MNTTADKFSRHIEGAIYSASLSTSSTGAAAAILRNLGTTAGNHYTTQSGKSLSAILTTPQGSTIEVRLINATDGPRIETYRRDTATGERGERLSRLSAEPADAGPKLAEVLRNIVENYGN